MTEIWTADFTFYMKLSAKEKMKGHSHAKFVVSDVITKRIPTRFIINEGLSYNRATDGMLKEFMSRLEDDKETGLKKFTITFIKKIGETNEK